MDGAIFNIFGLLFAIVPIVLTILVVFWIYTIKKNSEEQVRQNREIINLLQKLNSK